MAFPCGFERCELANQWFAIQVWAGRERLTTRNLRLRGYEVFLPCYQEQRRWSDRMKVAERALFPGYVFCRLRADARAAIVTTPRVIRIVGNNFGPVAVPTHEIENIQRIVESQLRVEPWSCVEAGQRVRIESGPLRGTEGIVVTVNKGQRLVVSIQLLQRSVIVELDPTWVRVAHEEMLHALRARLVRA